MGVLNYEMESATLFTMCASSGLRAGCVAGVLVNRTQQETPDEETAKRIESTTVAVVVEAARRLVGTVLTCRPTRRATARTMTSRRGVTSRRGRESCGSHRRCSRRLCGVAAVGARGRRRRMRQRRCSRFLRDRPSSCIHRARRMASRRTGARRRRQRRGPTPGDLRRIGRRRHDRCRGPGRRRRVHRRHRHRAVHRRQGATRSTAISTTSPFRENGVMLLVGPMPDRGRTCVVDVTRYSSADRSEPFQLKITQPTGTPGSQSVNVPPSR